MSTYKERLLELASTLTEEEFELLAVRVDILETRMASFTKSMMELQESLGSLCEVLAKFIRIDPEESAEDPATIEGLCETCARPCAKAKPHTYNCADYYEFKQDVCLGCDNWDVEVCASIDPCVDSSMYVPKREILRV